MNSYDNEFDVAIIDDDVQEEVIDYEKVPRGLVDISYDFGDDFYVCQSHVSHDQVKVKEEKKEDEVVEKELFLGDEETPQYARNELKEHDLPFTQLERQLCTVLAPVNWTNAQKVYVGLQDEWASNGAVSILTNWNQEEVKGIQVDRDKVNLMECYSRGRLRVSNKYLYEMYAYLLRLESDFGCKLIWSKHWRAIKYLLAFANFDYRKFYFKLIRMCDDRFFQQYINLVSLVYKWGLIFSYPYIEKYVIDSGMCESQMIVMTPVLDNVGEGIAKDKRLAMIGISRNGEMSYLPFPLERIFPTMSGNEILCAALVCKGWYCQIAICVAQFKDYTKYFGKYAFGIGMTKMCPIRNSHSLNSPYNGTFFGGRLYHQNYDCDECASAVSNNEMNVLNSDIEIDRYVQGYEAVLYVNYDMIQWLETVMVELPNKYRKVYDYHFCVTPGHFAAVYECVMSREWRYGYMKSFIEFYDKDFLFHMLLPFVPGALNWSWDLGAAHSRAWQKYEKPD